MAGEAARMKYWSELDSYQKIERTRDEVKRLQRDLQSAVRHMRDLMEHLHVDNKIVLPLDKHSGSSPSGGHIRTDSKEVFF